MAKIADILISTGYRYLPLHRAPSRFLEALNALQAGELTPVLLYHAVDHESGHPLIGGKVDNVSSEMLYEQLSLLKRQFRVLPLDELVARIRQGRDVRRLAAVTFDDGYLSVLKSALPVLDSLSVPATLFLATKLVEAGVLWRDKVRFLINRGLVEDFLAFARSRRDDFPRLRAERFYYETKEPEVVNSRLVDLLIDDFLAGRGETLGDFTEGAYCRPSDLAAHRSPNMTFGSHSHNHYALSSMSREEQLEDITTADHVLKSLGLPLSSVFSIPFGGQRYFNEATLDILRETGYTAYALAGRKVVTSHAGMKKNGDALVTLPRFIPVKRRSFLLAR